MTLINGLVNGLVNGLANGIVGGSSAGDGSYPAGAYYYFDVTNPDSWDNESDNFNSLTGNSLSLVNGNSSVLRKFDFVGDVGDAGAYFLTDGVNYFTANDGIMLTDMNNTSKSWTLTIALRTAPSFPGNDIVWSADSVDPSLILLYITNGNQLRYYQEALDVAGSYRAAPSVSLSVNTPTIISTYYDHVNELFGYSVNGRTYATESCIIAPDAAPLTRMNIFGRETSSLSMNANARLYAIDYRNHVATEAELSSITDFVNERHTDFNIP